MIVDSIHHQQTEKITRNSALRKAASSPSPPNLSQDETAMIQKKFASSKPISSYTMQGEMEKSSFFDRGNYIDRRI